MEVEGEVRGLLQSPCSRDDSSPGDDPTKVVSADASVDMPLPTGVETKTTKPAVIWQPHHKKSTFVGSAASAELSVRFGPNQRHSFDRFAAPSSVKGQESNNPFKVSVRTKTLASAASNEDQLRGKEKPDNDVSYSYSSSFALCATSGKSISGL